MEGEHEDAIMMIVTMMVSVDLLSSPTHKSNPSLLALPNLYPTPHIRRHGGSQGTAMTAKLWSLLFFFHTLPVLRATRHEYRHGNPAVDDDDAPQALRRLRPAL